MNINPRQFAAEVRARAALAALTTDPDATIRARALEVLQLRDAKQVDVTLDAARAVAADGRKPQAERLRALDHIEKLLTPS